MVNKNTEVMGYHVKYSSLEECLENPDKKMTVDLRFVCNKDGDNQL